MSTSDHPNQTEHRTQNDEPGTCPECGGALTADRKHAETQCADCGLVVEEAAIDRGPEWRNFDESQHSGRSRVGPPTTKTRHDDGLSTTIDWRNRDANGNALSPSKRQRMHRLRTWNERFRTRDARERGLKQALGEIDRMGSALGLPEHVRETASIIHRRAVEENLLPGRSLESISAACLYAAARQGDVPRSLEEVTAVSRVDRNDVARSYRYLLRELSLEVEPNRPEEYVGRFASQLDLESAIEYRARDLLEGARADGIDVGKSPVSLAAAAVYAAALLAEADVTQDDVATVTDVSEVTVRKRYRELLRADDDCPL